MKNVKIKPLNKIPIKDLKKLQQGAENEIVEYEEFIQQIKFELGRRKKCPEQKNDTTRKSNH